jgi:hypothetical protein
MLRNIICSVNKTCWAEIAATAAVVGVWSALAYFEEGLGDVLM